LKIKFASWNVKGFNKDVGQIRLLKRADCALVALQEVTDASYRLLVASGLFHSSSFSMSLRPAKPWEGRRRRLGCALFVKDPFVIESSSLIENVPVPERTLVAKIATPTVTLTVCSFHIPPGVNWGKKKSEQVKKLALWLAKKKHPVVVGMDANAPKRDHPNHEKNKWWWKEEQLLLGSKPAHHLKDCYRIYLDRTPSLMTRIRKIRPLGPLAISFKRGFKKKRICSRYDFILATNDFEIVKVRYLYKESIAAGSDHALVIAELQINKRIRRRPYRCHASRALVNSMVGTRIPSEIQIGSAPLKELKASQTKHPS